MGEDERTPQEGPVLRWTIHLAKRQPRRVWVVVAGAVLGGAFGVVMTGIPLMGLFGALVVLFGTADFLLPVHFEVSGRGASRRCGLSTTQIGWKDVRRVVVGEAGIKLSPLDRPGRLSPFRGVFLSADGNLEELRAAVEYWRQVYAGDVGEAPESGGNREADQPGGGPDQEAAARSARDTVS
ncbi:MAG: hypothetical protein D8M53_02825 [Armatimonadetes bacterium]|nr:MAG: hypothetical protein EDM73_00755 [Armatimonadota bacterium]MBC6969686.1 hypothetical protein [Armatimonadota bacterium]MBL1149124.1 hypothetical protein [Armatimonadota bacterium]MCE7898955.1 hypothetical protein [Armatimonadetes bacterium ATM1]RIJ97937.1 MAG: hypothetical protein DCC45_02425 [Armatimonadota bacterium]